LLGFILATLFSPTNSILTTIGIVLFSIYIIYDTNNILQKNYYGDFITASLDYYLDILNLFSLMSRDQ
jgi:FtsH-binding integral membrane protein